jgi:phi LC3 family holin
MSIEWKARIQSKIWWVGMVSNLIVLLQLLGVKITFIPTNYVDIINVIFILLGMLGITVDTSTPTLSDISKTVQATEETNTPTV